MGVAAIDPGRRGATPKPAHSVLREDEVGALPVKPPADGNPAVGTAAEREVDPFAGVYALALFLGVMIALFVAQQVAGGRLAKDPPAITVTLALPSEEPPPREAPPRPPPTPMPLRAQDTAPVGRSAAETAATLDTPVPAARAAQGDPGAPSEDRIVHEPPRPRGAPTPQAGASSAAQPSSDLLRLAPTDPADRAARAAALDSRPAGRRDDLTPPAAPGPPQPGAARAGGDGLIMAAGVVRGFKPDYPLLARQRGLEGTVLLRAVIGADGRVARVEVLRSSGHQLLDAAAREAIQRWQFSPARRTAGPIASTVEVPIEFKLND
jgi:protein TonB